MKNTLIILSLVAATTANSACQFTTKKEATVISWTAFKTPKKAPVGGKFNTFELISADSSSVEKAIETASFTIDSTSVNTANPARDKTIATNFFTKEGKAVPLSGKVKSLKGNAAVVALNFNGVTKDVPMTFVNKDNKVTLTGKIDVLEFALNDNFTALHNACKKLHEGKTWTDVDLSVVADFTKECK
jgi:polyisoprenoid-binding protein YceI